ncbi:uncharacterized protein [Mytilus edulis]|uniref:uncharacterized protein isoform X2 n=1 Tax=Mytilus edulis TaxID=6550 RepID=UPI0039F06B72
MNESARIVMCIGDILIKREPDEEEEDKKSEATQQSESKSRKADVDDSNSTFGTGNSSNSVIKTETTDEKDHGKQMNTCTSGNVRPGTCTTGNFPPGIYPAKNFPSGTCIHQAKKNPGQLNKQNTIKHQNYNVMRQLLAWGSNNRMRGKYKPDDINDMLHDSSNRTDKQSLIVTTLADVVNVKPLIVIDPGKDYDYNCIECGKILNPPFHQCLWQCKKCSFASVCMISFKAHYNRRHNGTLGPLNKVNQPCIQDMSVDNNLLLCTCGKCKSFHSCNPKEMCDHLNKCAMKGNKSCFTVSVFDKTDSTHSAATTQIVPPNPVSDPVTPLHHVDSQESPLQASNSTLNGILNDGYSASKILQKNKTDSTHSAATTQIVPLNPVSDPVTPLHNVDSQESPLQASNSTLNGMLNDGYSASKILQKILAEAKDAESKNSSTAEEKIPSALQSINSIENLAFLKSKFHTLSDTPHQDVSRDGQDSVRSTEPREKLTSIDSNLNTAERFTNVVNVMHQEPGIQSQKGPGVSNKPTAPRLLLANNDGRTALSPRDELTSEHLLHHSESENSVPTEFKPSFTPGNSDVLNQNFLPHFNIENSVPTEFKPSVTPGNSDVLNQNFLPHFNIENSVPTEFKPSVTPGNVDVLNHLPQNSSQGKDPRYTLNNAPNTVPHDPGLSIEPSIVMLNGVPHMLYAYNPQGVNQNTSPMSMVYSTASHLNASNTFSQVQSFGLPDTHFTSLSDNNSLNSSMPQHLNTSRANPVAENIVTSSFAQVKVESTDASENVHFSVGPVKTESIPVPVDENVQLEKDGTRGENNVGFQLWHISNGLVTPAGTANYQNINNQPVSIVKFVQQQNTLQMQGIMSQTNINNSQQLLQGAALSQMIEPVLELRDGKVQLKLCLRQPNQIAGGQIQSPPNNFVSLPLNSVNEKDHHHTIQNTTQTSNLAEVSVLPDMLNHKKRKRKDTHSVTEESSLKKRPVITVKNLIQKRREVVPETEVTNLIQKTAETLPETKEFGLTKNQAIAVTSQIKNTEENLSKTGGQKKFDKFSDVQFIIRSPTIADSIPVLASGMLACRICPKQFWHLDSLLQHHDMQLPEKRTDCGHVMFHIICDVCLIRRDNWIRATDSIICFCETCDKTYTSLLQFNHHVILLHGERKQCTFCKKDFLLKREFRDHVCERLKKLNHSYKMEKFVICYKMTVPLIQKLSKRQKLNVQKVKGSTNTNNGIICNNYEAEGDNCTRKAENDINTTDGGNGTHYLAEGSNGTHYLAEGGNGAHYLAGKKKTVSTKDSASKIVKTPSELFIRSCTLTDSKSEKETYIVRRINTKTEAVTRSNTKAEMVANSNTEAEMVTYSNTDPEMVSNSNTDPEMVANSNTEAVIVNNSNTEAKMVTNSNTEAEIVANSNTEAEMVANSNTEEEMVTNSNTEAEMVTNSNTEVEMVTFSNTEADMVANSNTEAEMVANSNTEAEMVAYSNTEAEMGAYSNTEAVMVANSNTEAEMVTNSNTEAEMVTNSNTEAEIVTRIHSEAEMVANNNTETEMVANSNTEAEMVAYSNTEAEMGAYSNTEAVMVANSNTEAEMVTNSNTEAEMVTNSNTEAEIVTRIKSEVEIVTNSYTEAEMVPYSNTEAEMVPYSNTEADLVTRIKSEVAMVTNSNTEAVMVANSNTEAEMVTNSNTEAEMVTNSNTEVEMVTFSNTEADMVANSNTEAEMVANSNTEAEMVAYSNTEAEMGAYSNTEAVMVANSNTEAEMVTNSNTEAEMVTNSNTEGEIVTRIKSEVEIVTNSYTEAEMVPYSNTEAEMVPYSNTEADLVTRIKSEVAMVTNSNTEAVMVANSNTEAEMVAYSNAEAEMVTNSNNEAEMVTNSNTEAEMVTTIKSEAEMVTNSNTEAEMVANSNTIAVMVTNSNTEAKMVTKIKSEAEMVTNSNTEAVMVANSNTEAEIVTRIKSEAEMVTKSNTEAEMVANSNTEAEMVANSNTEVEIVTNSNTEAKMVANSNTKAVMVANSNTEAEMVANSNTEAEMVANSNTEAEMVANSNTEAEMVANSNTEAEMVAYSNTEAEMVTRIHSEAEMVANNNTETDIVTYSYTEAEIVFGSNTVPGNFKNPTQINEIQLQDSFIVKEQIKTTQVNCFCSPCKLFFSSLKKLNAHAWSVHRQIQCVICHIYFTNHLGMCNHECARVIVQMKINPLTQIIVHFGSENKILERRVRGQYNQWYVFVKDNPKTLEETKTKDIRLPCYCRTCKIGLISLSQLNDHIYNVHTTRAECIYCKMDFDSTEEMGDHFCEKLNTKLKEDILTEITACPSLDHFDKRKRRGIEVMPWLRMSAKTLRQLAQEKLDKIMFKKKTYVKKTDEQKKEIFVKKTDEQNREIFVEKTDEQKKEILNQILNKEMKKTFYCFNSKRKQFVKKSCPVCSRIFFGTSDQSLYEHFYKKHQKDTKYCRFCQQAFFADNHECKKEKEESYMNRKGNKNKIKEELVGEESINLQKCPQCSYIKNFCKENIHNQTCTRKACFSCENCGECEGKNCFYCGKIFHFESLTWRHVEKKHRSTKTGIFHCYLCNITINTLEQLQLHVKTVHPLVDALSIYRKKTKYRQCRRKKKSIEQRLADAKKQRKKYQEKHKDRYKCEICQEKFTYYIMLRKHIANEHERETFGCNICNMQFKHKKTLERHQMKEHLKVCEKEKPKYTCFVCDQKYLTSKSLRRHKFKEHLIEDKHISKLRENIACEQCGKIVMRKCMRLHLLVHQEKEFMCEVCGEKFRRPDDLKRHRQKHIRKKYVLKSETSGYKCLICGLILSTNGAIKRHFSLKHSSEKIALPCKICGRLYASKPVLDIHMKLKHSDKSFQCEICNKKFYYNYLLKNHVKIVHENYKPFQCDICNFRCYMKSALVSHMKYNH